jgi:hypothetical protein
MEMLILFIVIGIPLFALALFTQYKERQKEQQSDLQIQSHKRQRAERGILFQYGRNSRLIKKI